MTTTTTTGAYAPIETKLTLQAAFEIVWEQFVLLRKPPSFYDGACKYNGPDDTHCAFAVLVPEDRRRLLVEHRGTGHQLTIPEIAEVFEADVDAGALNRLQGCHDDAAQETRGQPAHAFRDRIELLLRRLAEDLGLQQPSRKYA